MVIYSQITDSCKYFVIIINCIYVLLLPGLFHLACAHLKIALSPVLLIELFCSGINGLRNARVFCVFKEGLLQHTMIKGLCLELPLEIHKNV